MTRNTAQKQTPPANNIENLSPIKGADSKEPLPGDAGEWQKVYTEYLQELRLSQEESSDS